MRLSDVDVPLVLLSIALFVCGLSAFAGNWGEWFPMVLGVAVTAQGVWTLNKGLPR